MKRQQLGAKCGSNPSEMESPPHECSVDELCCVYCGVPLEPYNCHGCGQFLSCAEMHDDETRCEKCR